MLTEQHIQVIIVSGPDEPKKVVLGLSLAASAAAAGKIVHVFLTMDGARCLLQDICERPLVEGYPPVAELLGVIEATGGVVEYCPHCLPAGCVPRFGTQVAAAPKACGCGGAPAGISTYGVHLGERPTVAF